jgi:hypothetical protein
VCAVNLFSFVSFPVSSYHLLWRVCFCPFVYLSVCRFHHCFALSECPPLSLSLIVFSLLCVFPSMIYICISSSLSTRLPAPTLCPSSLPLSFLISNPSLSLFVSLLAVSYTPRLPLHLYFSSIPKDSLVYDFPRCVFPSVSLCVSLSL